MRFRKAFLFFKPLGLLFSTFLESPCLYRGHNWKPPHLPTPLLNFCNYMLWWHKPLDVQCPLKNDAIENMGIGREKEGSFDSKGYFHSRVSSIWFGDSIGEWNHPHHYNYPQIQSLNRSMERLWKVMQNRRNFPTGAPIQPQRIPRRRLIRAICLQKAASVYLHPITDLSMAALMYPHLLVSYPLSNSNHPSSTMQTMHQMRFVAGMPGVRHIYSGSHVHQ